MRSSEVEVVVATPKKDRVLFRVPSDHANKEVADKALMNRRSINYYHVELPENATQLEGRLSCCTYLSYAAPSFSTTPCSALISIYLVPFYEAAGANLAYIAFFIALARSFDVITDPLMSYATDSCRSKHGRRRPFLITGAAPYGVLLAFLCWAPAGWTSVSVSLYFGILYILFFLFGTYTNIPYDAVAPELTDNYEDRTRVYFYCTLFDALGGLIAVGGPVGVATLFSRGLGCDYSSCSNSLVGSIKTCAAISPYGAATYAYTQETYAIISGNGTATVPFDGKVACRLAYTQGGSSIITPYCTCREACKSLCSLESKRLAYLLIGVIFASWYVISMLNAAFHIKERSMLMLEKGIELMKNPPIVPSLLNTFQNRPFMKLIPCWVLDQLVQTIIATLMIYYVRYVIVPEYQPQCFGGTSGLWYCDSVKVMGAAVLVILMAAVVGTPIFMALAQRYGKRAAWLIWSATSAFTNILMLIPGEGDYVLCIVMAGINGLPLGAKFLSESILADIIDYDEFLTGTRAEATYTMFKSFLPKLCAIPAGAIPIALLNAIGHVPMTPEGMVQKQPPQVKTFVLIVIVILPTLFSIASFFLKFRFPMKTKSQVDEISTGVGRHLLGKAAVDPITGSVMPAPIRFDSDAEQKSIWRMQHFTGLRLPQDILCNTRNQAFESNKKRALKQMLVGGMMLCTTLGCSIGFFDLLGNKELSVIPVLSIIFFGMSMSIFLFLALRYRAAVELERENPDFKTVKKLLKHKIALLPARASSKATYLKEMMNIRRRSTIEDEIALEEDHGSLPTSIRSGVTTV
mgnify:CR=1 FL=1|jgi:glycoside/pentoside/hexuronide:cation symporter, GPH family